MNISGKCDGIEREDLLAPADVANIKKDPVNALIDRVVDVFRYGAIILRRSGYPGNGWNDRI